MKAIPYLRVSTDDKGQRPARQMEVIAPWAEREHVALLDVVADEGASATKTNPFERPAFVNACERAVAAGANAIVVECADRFTRQGSKEDGWAEVELQRRYGLRLFRADKPLDQHGTLVGDTVDALKAEVAREWAREHAKKVRTGMAKAKKDGTAIGRPRKELNPSELAQVLSLRTAGAGWRSIALAMSRARGAFDVADPARRRQLEVSHMHIRRVVERLDRNKTQSVKKPPEDCVRSRNRKTSLGDGSGQPKPEGPTVNFARRTFTVRAWLPADRSFVAIDDTGVMGWLSPDGFQPMGDWFERAACAKYGYRRIQERVVDVAGLLELVRELRRR